MLLVAVLVDCAYGSASRPIRQVAPADLTACAKSQGHTPTIDTVISQSGTSGVFPFPIG